MILGFYYHLPIFKNSSGLHLPAYLGVFLDRLASEFDQVWLFLHSVNPKEEASCDYTLTETKFRLVSLGAKTPAWDRFLFPKRTLRRIKQEVSQCDILLIRAPSPLAPAFYDMFNRISKIAYLIVGDYVDGSRNLYQPIYRKLPIQFLSIRNDFQLRTVIKKTLALVNSADLYKKYKPFADVLREVRTTTININDFFYRPDTCKNDEIIVLYSGRLDPAKGLRELIVAVAILVGERYNIKLHFAAWEDDPHKPIEKILYLVASERNISDRIIFLGRKKVGNDLNTVYRHADIFALPSYHEGFPRSIWEAMANGLPVIASDVGSISSYVGNSVKLIQPRDAVSLADAIREVILNQSLRKELISAGYRIAKENTLEIRVSEIAVILKEWFKGKMQQA